jgi:hypothetical protein
MPWSATLVGQDSIPDSILLARFSIGLRPQDAIEDGTLHHCDRRYCGRIQMSSRTLTDEVNVWPPTVSRTM